MASLSNINGLFDVHSTGAILFSNTHGTSGQILRSNGNAAPTWVAASTVIGGPYLPLTGGTLTGPLSGTSATFSGIIYSSGGFRTGSTNSSYNLLTRNNSNGSYPLYCQNSLGVFGDAAIARFAYGSYGANTGTAVLDVRSGTSYFNDCNLGIGTTSPERILHVESDSVAAIQLENTSEADSFIDFKNPSRTFRVGYDDSADVFKVAVTNFNSNALVVNSSGNVGIGTASPYKKLEVVGDLQLDASNASMWIKSGATGTSGFINWTFNSDDTVYNKIGIDYDTRASTGFHIDTGYPLTLDCTNYIDFKRSGGTLGRWNSTGLGIGTVSPSRKLTIDGTTSTAINIKSNTTNGLSFLALGDADDDNYAQIILDNATNKLQIQNGGGSGITNRGITLDSSENVGIGTASPAASAKLTIMGNQTFGLPGNGTNTSGRFISIEGNTDSSGEGSSRIFFTEHNSSTAAMDKYGMSLGYRGGGTSIVGSSGNTWTGLTQIGNGQWGMWGHNNNAAGSLVMFGDRAATYVSIPGKVGIGTTNPTAKLTVNDGNVKVIKSMLSGGTDFDFLQLSFNGGWSGNIGGLAAINFTDSITATNTVGRIGVTYTGSQGKFVVTDLYSGGYAASGDVFTIQADGKTYIKGNVGIGTESTTVGGVGGHKLVIDATSQNLGIKTASGSNQAVRFANGSTAVGSINLTTSSTTYSTSSDYRLKEDLQDFAGLDMVSKIPVYDFKWKTNESRSYGVMAHELQEVLPDAVVGEKDAEEMQGVDYSKIVTLLVKAIQELKAEIEILKNK
jgi:hypothetical protein